MKRSELLKQLKKECCVLLRNDKGISSLARQASHPFTDVSEVRSSSFQNHIFRTLPLYLLQ